MSEARAPSGERGRWSSRRKTEVVLRALRGEDLDALSRELGVTATAPRGVSTAVGRRSSSASATWTRCWLPPPHRAPVTRIYRAS
jgi:hypothetical protein